MNEKSKLHRDGTVTYWSVYRQEWVRHARCLPNEEAAAMSATERTRVLLHLSPLWWGWVAGLGNFRFRAVDEEHARFRVGAAARRLLRSVRGTGEPPESRLIGRV